METWRYHAITVYLLINLISAKTENNPASSAWAVHVDHPDHVNQVAISLNLSIFTKLEFKSNRNHHIFILHTSPRPKNCNFTTKTSSSAPFFTLVHPSNVPKPGSKLNLHHKLLESHALVKKVQTLHSLQRRQSRRVLLKRSFSDTNFHDPLFAKQWHLRNTYSTSGKDLKIIKVWKAGITGKNVTVAIIDDGVDYTHKDLSENYSAFKNSGPAPKFGHF